MPGPPTGHTADNGGIREETWLCMHGSLISERHISSPWEQSLGRPGGGEHCGRSFPIRLCRGAGSHLKESGEERKEEPGSGGPTSSLTPHPPRTNPAGLRAEQVGRQLVLLLNSSCSLSRVGLLVHLTLLCPWWSHRKHPDTYGLTAPCQSCRMRLTIHTIEH